MKRKLTYSILSLIIILSCSVIGCSSSTKESEPANAWAIDLLDKAPNGASLCRLTNLNEIRSDPYLSDEYESITNFGFWDMYGLEPNHQNLNYVIETDNITVFIGNFSLENLKERLSENGSNYRIIAGAEVWDWEYVWKGTETILGALFDSVVAIHDGVVLASQSEDALKDWFAFTANDSPSINSDPDFNDIFSRLPNGFFITYSNNPPDGFDSQGLEALAGVSSKKDHGLVTWTGIYKYQDENAAKEAYPNVKTLVENEDEAQNIQVTRDGKYIRIKADYPIATSTDN